MKIIPAIDIKNGKCVRLREGRMETARIYYEDPKECALYWIEQGSKYLHLVDLDAAVKNSPENRSIIQDILHCVPPEVKVQVGGGVRNTDLADYYLQGGADSIIIGTWALKNPHEVSALSQRYPNRIYLGLDMADGKVRIAGWTEETQQTPEMIIRSFQTAPLAGIIMTDIERDGTLAGVNTRVFLRMRKSMGDDLPLIAAGGVRTLADILALQKSGAVNGVICGKSLYENTLNFRDALDTLGKK